MGVGLYKKRIPSNVQKPIHRMHNVASKYLWGDTMEHLRGTFCCGTIRKNIIRPFLGDAENRNSSGRSGHGQERLALL